MANSLVTRGSMPRFFFNVRNHVHTRDNVGTELIDASYAHAEALLDIDDIKRAKFSELEGRWDGWSIEVCDEYGDVILIVPFVSN